MSASWVIQNTHIENHFLIDIMDLSLFRPPQVIQSNLLVRAGILGFPDLDIIHASFDLGETLTPAISINRRLS
jgi:hypothetical protein